MKKAFLYLVLILFIPVLISQKPPRNGDKPYVEGQIMIKLRSDLPQSQQQMLQDVIADFQSVDLAPVEKLSDRLNIFLLNFNPDLIEDQRLLENIKANPYVEMAQFNHFVQMRETIPNDTYFPLQWNMHNTGQTGGIVGADIHGPEGWDLGTSGVTATGDTIIIGIDDDGFDLDHEDLSFWKNYHEIPNNGIDDDSNGYVDDYDGWNAWSNNGNIIEKDHGTHVTGIAAAHGNNGKGVTGVNWKVKVMPVVGSATVESIVVAGYAYILEMRSQYNETNGEKGAFVVSTNASFGVNNGDPQDFPIWGAMYDSLGMRGILSAAATANANWNVDEVGDIPTAFTSDYLISVTNTDQNDAKNAFAAYGPVSIDLGAPGTNIYSTRQTNAYGYKTGTSMASPHVAGAVAYMFSVANADFMTAYHNDPAGMALVVKQYLLNGTDTVASLEGMTVTGGRLNIYKAATLMLDPKLIFNPLSVLEVLPPDKLDTIPLQFTNNTSEDIHYTVDYYDTLSWINVVGIMDGLLNAGQTATLQVYFSTIGMPEDTLATFITFKYGNSEQFLVPVHLFIEEPVSVGPEIGSGEAAKQGSMEIWPNPAREGLRFKVSGLSIGKEYSVGIYDAAGKLVQEVKADASQPEIFVNTESFQQGTYFARLREGNKILQSKKILIVN